jgi:hypothetical protein
MNQVNATTAPSALGQAFTLHGRFALLLACVLAALWLSVAWLNHKDDERAYDEMRQRSSALALAFADHTDATFRSSDHIVLQLRQAWLENPKAFGSAIVAQQTLLGDTSIQIAVIDADGYLVYSNLGAARERVFLGDREHFKVHQVGGRADRLFVSRPVKGRVSGKWSIQHLAHALRIRLVTLIRCAQPLVVQLQALDLCRTGKQVTGFVQQCFRVKHGALQLKFAGLNFGQVQNVVEQG